jgi:hypothetical protein
MIEEKKGSVMSFNKDMTGLMRNFYENVNCDDRIQGYGKRGVYVQHTGINNVYNVTRLNCEPIEMTAVSRNILCEQIEEAYPDCRYLTKQLSQKQSNFLQQVNQMPSYHTLVEDFEPLREMRLNFENRNMVPDEKHINNDGSVRVMETERHVMMNNILNPKGKHQYAVFGSEFDEMTDQAKTNSTVERYLPLKEVHLNNDYATHRVVNGDDVNKKENLLGGRGLIKNAVIR